MIGESTQNLTFVSKMFKILINQYKKYINTLLSKDKKKEILDLFTNSNQLRSEEEFKEIECNLHDARRVGDIDLIQIYLLEKVENPTKDLSFKIDRTKKTKQTSTNLTNLYLFVLIYII